MNQAAAMIYFNRQIAELRRLKKQNYDYIVESSFLLCIIQVQHPEYITQYNYISVYHCRWFMGSALFFSSHLTGHLVSAFGAWRGPHFDFNS